MKYISAEQFQEQPKEVQKVLLNWWKPSIGDLFIWVSSDIESEHTLRKVECCTSINMVELTSSHKGLNEGERIPLLTEGQLREFIEDETEYRLLIGNKFKYSVRVFKDSPGIVGNEYLVMDNDLLQAYWQVTCKIAMEVTNE